MVIEKQTIHILDPILSLTHRSIASKTGHCFQFLFGTDRRLVLTFLESVQLNLEGIRFNLEDVHFDFKSAQLDVKNLCSDFDSIAPLNLPLWICESSRGS